MYLPDVNVWLALAFPLHAHHLAARAWFHGVQAGYRCHFCRITQNGFLRLANNPRVLPQAAVTQDQAWALYDGFLADPRIGFAGEPPALETHWRQFAGAPQFSPNSWTDAYLAAFALAGGLEVVTFDRGFAQYKAVHSTILS